MDKVVTTVLIFCISHFSHTHTHWWIQMGNKQEDKQVFRILILWKKDICPSVGGWKGAGTWHRCDELRSSERIEERESRVSAGVNSDFKILHQNKLTKSKKTILHELWRPFTSVPRDLLILCFPRRRAWKTTFSSRTQSNTGLNQTFKNYKTKSYTSVCKIDDLREYVIEE